MAPAIRCLLHAQICSDTEELLFQPPHLSQSGIWSNSTTTMHVSSIVHPILCFKITITFREEDKIITVDAPSPPKIFQRTRGVRCAYAANQSSRNRPYAGGVVSGVATAIYVAMGNTNFV